MNWKLVRKLIRTCVAIVADVNWSRVVVVNEMHSVQESIVDIGGTNVNRTLQKKDGLDWESITQTLFIIIIYTIETTCFTEEQIWSFSQLKFKCWMLSQNLVAFRTLLLLFYMEQFGACFLTSFHNIKYTTKSKRYFWGATNKGADKVTHAPVLLFWSVDYCPLGNFRYVLRWRHKCFFEWKLTRSGHWLNDSGSVHKTRGATANLFWIFSASPHSFSTPLDQVFGLFCGNST